MSDTINDPTGERAASNAIDVAKRRALALIMRRAVADPAQIEALVSLIVDDWEPVVVIDERGRVAIKAANGEVLPHEW